MSQTRQTIELTGGTDQYGQVYVDYASAVDKAQATLNVPHSGARLAAAWVSGNKQVTVKVVNDDGSPHSGQVTVTATGITG